MFVFGQGVVIVFQNKSSCFENVADASLGTVPLAIKNQFETDR